MKLRLFGISSTATLQSLKETELSASWQQDDTHRWIDVEAATQDDLRQLLAPLGLHKSLLNACIQFERSTRFISQRNAMYFELPTHLGWDEVEKPYLSVICLNTTIITIHRDPLHTIEDIMSGLDEEVPLYAKSSSALLYYVLMEIGRCNVDAALDVRAEAERLDQISNESLEDVDPQMIAALRRRINHHAAVHDDHTYCAGVLQTVESEVFSAQPAVPVLSSIASAEPNWAESWSTVLTLVLAVSSATTNYQFKNASTIVCDFLRYSLPCSCH